MEENGLEGLSNLIKKIKVTPDNEELIRKIENLMDDGKYIDALPLIRKLKEDEKKGKRKKEKNTPKVENNDSDNEEETVEPKEDEETNDYTNEYEEEEEDIDLEIKEIYPEELSNIELEKKYIGMLLKNPKAISMYYILFEDCYFESDSLLNLYKSILFTEGEEYAPQIAKNNFNFAKETYDVKKLRVRIKEEAAKREDNYEKIYLETMKLFEIRKNYLSNPMKELQDKIVGILKYELYDQMSIQEVKDAIEQITATEKFKRAVLNDDITDFLLLGDNNLTNGLDLPFPILSSVFKGVRKGETMAYAMPSNSGKSRFTINLAAYLAFIHQKKVLIISNEMSEEKMRLCLITTVLNNKEIQKLHKQQLTKTEGELLEFKFRPDNKDDVEIDEDGFVLKKEGESQKDFAKRLSKVSSEFRSTIEVTKWLDSQIKNSIYFVNITNHTNDELEKVILNYYYKEKIEYIFYDTLKTDTENIGNGEEIKKTATILSNLAQNLNIFIASSLQLTESSTLPINLNINDLAVSRTVKEVLDTLCLIKQVHNEDLDKYEYSHEEVDTKFYPLEKFKDPDVRYYICVVDKNRAGAKPKVIFRLNLAYNFWEELGYVRLKS